ncbi:hypothetical protein HYG86_13490 [Alkalicella caledoniensis]|uniref:Uncharacterized protein n=1 Tax=Alkalicella caledoniensis TaxID=2731377 RepID=A0A7G9WAJ9_ALKCA|nr:hypothetical protein [Alkalicella caledoniensis]QNO15711.1 hypothetical protein HYG86_13490 [Alkalicella caledoniensis]
MNKKGFTLFVITLTIMFMLMSYYNSQNVEGLVPAMQGERHLIVNGEQHGISYQIYKGNTQDHFVIRFYKENESIVNAKITDLKVNLEIENGKLLSVAPAGKIEGNKSEYVYSSRRGLNSQLEDKGIFVIFKIAGDENSKGALKFSITEYTQISKTTVELNSDPIKFPVK